MTSGSDEATTVTAGPEADAGERVVRRRLRTILAAVDRGSPATDPAEWAGQVVELVRGGEPAVLWLTLAVLRAEFPLLHEFEAAQRVVRLDGADVMLAAETAELAAAARRAELPEVVVLDRGVTVDGFHTASVDFVTGIQRVVRETVPRWAATHRLTAVGWTDEYRAFRALRPVEAARLFGPAAADADRDADPAVGAAPGPEDVLIPWRGVHVVSELTVEPQRTGRMRGLARYSGTELALIGYDVIPLTSPETVSTGMNSNFVQFLAAAREAKRVAAISVASAIEFRGWRRMVAAAGFPGPDVDEVVLPSAAREPTPDELARAQALLGIPTLPLVLVVGSHEPRKNHLAVLHAAEQLWRDGVRFNLVMVGGGSWMADRFRTRVAQLQAARRPLLTITGLPDELLWAAYRLARCVLFPSLNEGFGLPVAEALDAGTPVITSDFGSTRELVAPAGEPLGGLLIDPRDDADIAAALRRLLTDDRLHAELAAQAAGRSFGSWDDYAERTWHYLTAGAP